MKAILVDSDSKEARFIGITEDIDQIDFQRLIQNEVASYGQIVTAVEIGTKYGCRYYDLQITVKYQTGFYQTVGKWGGQTSVGEMIKTDNWQSATFYFKEVKQY